MTNAIREIDRVCPREPFVRRPLYFLAMSFCLVAVTTLTASCGCNNDNIQGP